MVDRPFTCTPWVHSFLLFRCFVSKNLENSTSTLYILFQSISHRFWRFISLPSRSASLLRPCRAPSGSSSRSSSWRTPAGRPGELSFGWILSLVWRGRLGRFCKFSGFGKDFLCFLMAQRDLWVFLFLCRSSIVKTLSCVFFFR